MFCLKSRPGPYSVRCIHVTGLFCFTSEIDKWPRYKMYVAYDIQIPIKIFQSNYSIMPSLYVLYLTSLKRIRFCCNLVCSSVIKNYIYPHFSQENFKRIIKELPRKYLASTILIPSYITQENCK